MGMGKQKVAPAAACYALPCPVEAEGELGGKGAQLNGLCRCFDLTPGDLDQVAHDGALTLEALYAALFA